MAINHDEVIDVLNGLIETCKDGQQGFTEAAEGVTDPSVRTLFQQYARQRAQFAGELQTIVRQMGGDPEKSGSFTGALHRGWINIKSAVTGNDAHNLLEECERGEDSAVSNYRNALSQELPTNIKDVVQKQFSSIREAHDRVRNLRNASSSASA